MATRGGQTMVGALERVIVKRPSAAFVSQERIEAQWRGLGFTAPPDLEAAEREHGTFVEKLRSFGAEVLDLPEAPETTLDSIYTHDPGLMTDQGMILFQTGKKARRSEAEALARSLEEWEIPILARIEGRATAEGGDMLWLDERTLVVGRSYRTNQEGCRALREILSPFGIEVREVHLPHGNGRGEVLHLLSLISPVDRDLVLLFSRLAPVPLVELLEDRGIDWIELPSEEFESQGGNVLALAPRQLLMLEGNPRTAKALVEAGCAVETFNGGEISLKGFGGPTCLTRPISRRSQ